jgi:hypothetical protein
MANADLNESQKRELLAERDDQTRHGIALCEKTVEDGGFAEYFSPEDGLDIEDVGVKAHTAIMLENAKKWMKTMDEATLSLTTGGYRDHIFPIIRAAFPNNPINRIVSVQPQSKKNGTIYWMNYVIGLTRGQFKRGQTIFDANNGWQGQVGYTDENITGETFVTAGSATQGFTLAFNPIAPGQVDITIAQGTGMLLRDNGNGGLTLVKDGGTGFTLSSSSINYITGVVSAVFSSALTVSEAISVNYGVDLEGQGGLVGNLPQIDIALESSGVTAVRRPVSMRISMESMQDFQAEMGMDMGQTIVQGAAQMLLTDTGAEVVQDLWTAAGASAFSFDVTPSTGLGLAEHFRDINYPIQQASGQITNSTQRGEATFIICDQGFLNVLKTIGAPQFVGAPGMTSKAQGLVFVGTFDGLEVFRYKYLSSLPGASSTGNAIVGYKGEDFWDTGYVWAPYQQLYTNGPDERADLTRRQAWAMRYAKKTINNAMYVIVTLTT